MASVTVSAQTAVLLRDAVSRMDELGHRIAVAEEREAREPRAARERADHAVYLTSREHLIDVQAAARQEQARADDALEPWGMRAPAYVASESLDDYQRRLLRLCQRQLSEDNELRGLRIKTLPDDAFARFKPQIYAECKAAASRPDSAAADELRQVVRINPANGQKTIEFYGRECFVKQVGRPGRRVVSSRTDQGFVDASGRALDNPSRRLTSLARGAGPTGFSG